MSRYSALKAIINQVITTNGQGDITGAILNQVLKDMVTSLGAYYQYGGIATPTTNPGNPDQRVFYIATIAGTYTNFGTLTVPNGISILQFDESWSLQTLDLSSYLNNVVADGVVDGTRISATTTTSDRKTPDAYSAGSVFTYYDSTNDTTYYYVALTNGTAGTSCSDPTKFFATTSSTQAVYQAMLISSVIATGPQSFSPVQKEQAATNIGLGVVVKGDVQQSLSDIQQVQAQNNMVGKVYDAAQFSGLGKKVLAKNIQTVGGVQKNVMTQAFFQDSQSQPLTNTVFVIQQDYTLLTDITIPSGAVLYFDGGRINGGRLLIGGDTQIFGNKCHADLDGIVISSGNVVIKDLFLNLNNAAPASAIVVNNQVSSVNIDGCRIIIDRASLTQATDASCIFINGASNINISNCYLKGSKNDNYTTGSYHGCIYCKDASEVRITNCELTDAWHECAVLDNCTDSVIASCVIHDTGNTDDPNSGYSAIATSGGDRLIINGNTCFNTGASCISFNSKNSVCSNNVCYNARKANGIAFGHLQDGSEVYNSACIGNEVYSCQFGIGGGNLSNSLIADNNIHDITENGINISISYVSASQKKGVNRIAGNILSNIAYYGINYIESIEQWTAIESNTFDSIKNNYAIRVVTHNYAYVCNNSVYNSKGIKVERVNADIVPQAYIFGNIIHTLNETSDAILLTGITFAKIKANKILSNNGHAIHCAAGPNAKVGKLFIDANDIVVNKAGKRVLYIETGVFAANNNNLISITHNNIEQADFPGSSAALITNDDSVWLKRYCQQNCINSIYRAFDFGTTTDRPIFVSGNDKGYPFWDLTLSKLIFYKSTTPEWTDALGNIV